MSKCVKCGHEILTGDIHWEMGLCNNCYNELYKDHKTHISLDKMWLKLAQSFRDENEKLQDKVADLEAKLAESEKERELDNSFWKQECDGLQKALAEKTLTIEQINKAFIGNRSLWKGKYERANQDKISFAVEVLKIAQDYVQQYVNDFDDMNDCICAIDKLIKQLTHQHEDKGE